MPRTTRVEISPAEQAWLLAEVRRARYGYLRALHLLRLGAAGQTPRALAAVLFCSRSPVDRVSRAYRAGTLTVADATAEATRQRRLRLLTPSLKRSLLALLKTAPRAYGWCRTRWSCATLAGEVQVQGGMGVSAETVRRWLQEIGWEGKRAKVAAKDDDPQRVEKLARIRYTFAQRRMGAALFFAEELAITLLPQLGYHWMPQGEQVEGLTPGTNEKRSLAGALDVTTGTLPPWVWYRKTTGLFLDLLMTLDQTPPASTFTRLTGVVDNAKLHHATEVEQWLAAPPRFALLSLPTYCPRANPIERACGDVHDKCTRTHTRKRLWHLLHDVKQHLLRTGPWRYALSALYYTSAVTAAVERLRAGISPPAISQLAA